MVFFHRFPHSMAKDREKLTCPPDFQSTKTARLAKKRKTPGDLSRPTSGKRKTASTGVALLAQSARSRISPRSGVPAGFRKTLGKATKNKAVRIRREE